MASTSAAVVLKEQESICAYAISGQYGALVRGVFILLLVLGILFHKNHWIVGGTVVFTIIYTSTTAIHTLLLASDYFRWHKIEPNTSNSHLDLDLLPVFFIVETTLNASIHIRLWSISVRNAASGTGVMLTLWQMLLMAASITTWGILWLSDWPVPPPTGVCPTRYGFMREEQTTIEIRNTFRHDISKFNNLTRVPSAWNFFCAFTAMIYHFKYPKKRFHVWAAELRDRAYENDEMWPGLPPFLFLHHLVSWVGGLVHVLCWFGLILYITAMELVLRQSKLPVGEGLGSVGQWSPVVGSFLTLAGALWIFWRTWEEDSWQDFCFFDIKYTYREEDAYWSICWHWPWAACPTSTKKDDPTTEDELV